MAAVARRCHRHRIRRHRGEEAAAVDIVAVVVADKQLAAVVVLRSHRVAFHDAKVSARVHDEREQYVEVLCALAEEGCAVAAWRRSCATRTSCVVTGGGRSCCRAKGSVVAVAAVAASAAESNVAAVAASAVESSVAAAAAAVESSAVAAVAAVENSAAVAAVATVDVESSI